jgi:hypothetical protein
MPSYRASVVGPVALDKVLRFVTLALLVPAMLFALACGGGSSSTTTTVGPAPTFTSTAPQIASEGIQYSYAITTTTTDNSTVTYTMTTGPTGAAITGSTLTWTPTHAQARISNGFTITATTSNSGVFTQTFNITPTGNINGTAVDNAVAGGTLVDYPQDMSSVTVEVLLPNNKGGFNRQAGTGDASGNFTIPNVPAGNYWLHLQHMDNGAVTDNYLYTSASDIDAGQLVIGRPDAVRATSGVTIAAQNIALSVPVTSSDSIAWVSPDANASGAPAGAPASQTYSATFPQTGGLINSSKGDSGYLLHYTTSGLITREVESETFPSLTETNGGTVSLTGSMTANTGSTTDPVVKVSEFDAVNTAIPGFTAPTVKNFTMFDSAYDGSNGFLPANLYAASGSTPIQLIKILLATVTTDTDFGSIPYGLVTSKGVPFVQCEDLGSRSFSIGGSNYSFQNNGQVTITNVIPSSSNSTFPLVGEPLNPTVDGKDFFTNQGSISGAPQIAWATPTFGAPSSYELTVVNPATLGGANPEIHYFYTFSTGVAIPPGILKANTSYVFILQAMLFQANNFQAAPFRMGTNAAWTSEVSAVMTTNSTGAATVRNRAAASTSRRQVLVTPGANGKLSVTVTKK